MRKEEISLSDKRFSEKASHLGKLTTLKGELTSGENLFIEGNFQGRIEVKDNALIVEEGAKLEADIWAGDITVRGEIRGNIFASGKVLIESQAFVEGNITAAKISIMDGAHFKGSIKMRESLSSL